MTKFHDRKTESIVLVNQLKRNISKTELSKRILIAIPNSVEFHNYESNKLYRKVVILQNVSTSLARFQLAARPIYSRFTVMIEYKGQKSGICPGMHVKLIIFFRCDILDEPEEMLMINVQQGRSVIIKLRGRRDSPILRMTTIAYFQYPRKELRAKTVIKSDRKWFVEIPFTQINSYEKEKINSQSRYTFGTRSNDISNTSEESVMYCKKLKSFECGKCLLDQQVILSLMVKNIGGEGRFFIMSEIDWCSMHIEV
ncbi:uncharacterized protein LOC114938606 isoform X2 [Nylanderia fulva]|uniref:uncharacterized protein LOC114938606 isoform X2 n=1 Tax=Nylanderia fulva TaxID=613905 RepID=UPI0010FB9F6E|nr:uncharacterized protein LOC114938606 isoform X2 [Nylanderia fulva]